MNKKIIKGIGVIILTAVLSTVTIDAADNLGNMKQSILGAALFSVIGEPALCSDGMVLVDTSEGGFCIDVYEVSASEECSYLTPKNQDETNMNLNQVGCLVESKKDGTPWVNIAQHQAKVACSKAGKRLPSGSEWYEASLGTPDPISGGVCNLDDSKNQLINKYFIDSILTRSFYRADCLNFFINFDN